MTEDSELPPQRNCDMALLVCVLSISMSLHAMQRKIYDWVDYVNAATTRFYATF
jgi:hypothetical protein